MSEPVRILLRLVGFLLFLAGIAGIVLLFKPGPGEIADWMGKSCDQNARDLTNGGQCSAFDVLLILVIAPTLILVGGVLALALRPEDKGPITLDFSRRG